MRKSRGAQERRLPDSKESADKFLCDLVRAMVFKGTLTATINLDVENNGLMGSFELEIKLSKYNGRSIE